jgi:hypothetical protein
MILPRKLHTDAALAPPVSRMVSGIVGMGRLAKGAKGAAYSCSGAEVRWQAFEAETQGNGAVNL